MALPPPLASQHPARRASLKRRLEGLSRTFDRSYLETDPLVFVHRYRSEADREIVGFLASGLAFGNVKAIQASLRALLEVMGKSPAAFVDAFDPARQGAKLAGIYHRWVGKDEFAALFVVLRRMREEAGSIGRFFMKGHDPNDPDVGAALTSFCERAKALAPDAAAASGAGIGGDAAKGTARGPGFGLRSESGSGSGFRPSLRTPRARGKARRMETPHTGAGSVAPFFASPKDGSACKRLNLYLRWMVRDGDGLDLGLWPGISRRQLVLPLDTHLVRLSRALGLTQRKSPGWRMAVEATRSLAILDPDDPVKYDFALSRLGILDLCLHGLDPLDCTRCKAPHVRVRAGKRRPRPAR